MVSNTLRALRRNERSIKNQSIAMTEIKYNRLEEKREEKIVCTTMNEKGEE